MQPGPDQWHADNLLWGALGGIGLIVVSVCLVLLALDFARGYLRTRREQRPGFDVKLRKP